LKKILFFTCEPGGAEVLIPVINHMLKDNNFEIVVLGYGYAVNRFEKQNVNLELIEPIKKNDFLLLDKYRPDYIITSATSLPQKDMSEKYIWHNAKHRSIPTIAFLDQWQNYAIRFSGVTQEEYMIYQPDFINCINDIGKKEMIKLGFECDKLFKLGQPYLNELKNNLPDKNIICKKLELNNKKEVVLFVSEAIEEHFKDSRGYTQYETIDYLLRNKEFLNNKQVIIKLHPKDNITKFEKYKNIILIQNEFSSLEMISISDYVIGMTSIMLIESYILEKKVLSIQLNAKEDLLLLSQENFIKKITDCSHNIHNSDFVNTGNFLYKFNYLEFKECMFNETMD